MQLTRRLVASAVPLFVALSTDRPAAAADLGSLGQRFQDDASATLRSGASSGSGALGLDVYISPILGAQRDVRKLLDDQDTFRTMVSIGLPTTSLPTPQTIFFSSFQKLENYTKEPGAFMDAAIEYIEYARDLDDLVELARRSRTNGGGPAATQDYLERALVAAKGASKALDRMVPLLP